MFQAAMAAGMAGSGGSSHSTASGGDFSGGSLGGINFGQYKSADQTTIIFIGIVVLIAVIIASKK